MEVEDHTISNIYQEHEMDKSRYSMLLWIACYVLEVM